MSEEGNLVVLIRIRDHLIDDARHAWRFLSVWLIALAGVADILYEHIPFVQQYMPQGTVSVLAGLALIGRLYKQKSIEAKK